MASNLENLKTARANLLAKLAEVSADPKPSYNIDGQSVQWSQYYKMLTDQAGALLDAINNEEPFEEVSRGVSNGCY